MCDNDPPAILKLPTQSKLIHIFWCWPLLVSFGFAAELYHPAVADIAKSFQLELSQLQGYNLFFMAAFGSGCLLLGSLSDSLGRKPLLLFSIALTALGSVMCGVTTELKWYVIGKILQSMGAAGMQVTVYAMVRDAFTQQQLSRAYAFTKALMGLSAFLAPLIALWILSYFNWRVLFFFHFFWLMAVLGLSVYYVQETYLQKNLAAIFKILKHARAIITHPQFKMFTLLTIGAQAASFAFHCVAPVLYFEQLQLSRDYFVLLLLGNAVWAFIVNLLFGQFFDYFTTDTWIQVAATLLTLAGLSMLLAYAWHGLTVTTLYVPVLLFSHVGCIILGITATRGALAPFTEQVGAASSLFNFIEFIVGGMIGSTILLWPITIFSLSGYLMGIGAIIYMLLRYYRQAPLAVATHWYQPQT